MKKYAENDDVNASHFSLNFILAEFNPIPDLERDEKIISTKIISTKQSTLDSVSYYYHKNISTILNNKFKNEP